MKFSYILVFCLSIFSNTVLSADKTSTISSALACINSGAKMLANEVLTSENIFYTWVGYLAASIVRYIYKTNKYAKEHQKVVNSYITYLYMQRYINRTRRSLAHEDIVIRNTFQFMKLPDLVDLESSLQKFHQEKNQEIENLKKICKFLYPHYCTLLAILGVCFSKGPDYQKLFKSIFFIDFCNKKVFGNIVLGMPLQEIIDEINRLNNELDSRKIFFTKLMYYSILQYYILVSK